MISFRSVKADCFLVVLSISMQAWALDPSGPDTASSRAPEEINSRSDEGIGLLEPPVPIRPGASIQRMIVRPGPDGTSIVQELRQVIAQGSGCQEDTNSVYCNTLGAAVWAPSAANRRFADDIVVTRSRCALNHFSFQVTGDLRQDGSGTGPYTVTYGLYPTCPGGSASPQPLPGTSGAVQITTNIGGITEIVHIPGQTVVLPRDSWLALSFSRTLAGAVVGAPPVKGFSADRLDLPGAPCGGQLGGFPQAHHASLNAEFYVSGECGPVTPGFRNTNHAAAGFSEGQNVRFADEVTLRVPQCDVVAYDVTFKGATTFVDLRTHLDNLNPVDGGVIAGTRGQCLLTGADVDVCHVRVDPPVRLPSTLWVGFSSSSANRMLGPVRTCLPPLIGSSGDFHMTYDEVVGEWVQDLESDGCWDSFDVTIYCEGEAQEGACCDMVLLECVGGNNAGKRCRNNSECTGGGTCESACRDLPELNCASTYLDAPRLWQQGKTCGPSCVSGPNSGESCVSDAECIECVGGDRDGQPCCPGGACTSGTCVGGTRAGQSCCPNGGTCLSGTCAGGFCAGGSRSGQPCMREVDCPEGACLGQPFVEACGIAACCKPGDPDERICENLTRNECFTLAPGGPADRFQIGEYCRSDGQPCPINACFAREGECTLPRDAQCDGGERDGQVCDFFEFPSRCWVFPAVTCGGNCVGGTRDGQLCDPFGINVDCPNGVCTSARCVGGGRNGLPCCSGGLCPPIGTGTCQRATCEGVPGCRDPLCCSEVCRQPNQIFCCLEHWDQICANTALQVCENLRPKNDECYDPNARPVPRGAAVVQVPGSVDSDNIHATPNGFDPGFCCHSQEPGARGEATTWFRFVAPATSVRLTTCASVSRSAGLAKDSLLAVFAVADPDLGLCNNADTCSVSAQDCRDGSECKLDEAAACAGLTQIACNDDAPCDPPGPGPLEPERATLCVTNLVPSHPY